MASLSPKELLKYDWRVEVFLRKYKSKDKKERTFDLVNNKKVSFIYDPDVAKVVSRKNQVQLRTVRLLGEDGNEYKLSDLEKSAEFGGKGAGSGTLKEDIELQRLIKQLNDIRKKQKTGTVPIEVGGKTGKTFNVADAITTPGTPKSDFHLVDDNGTEVVWISHKDGRTARDFQQWGGISKRSEPTIFSHPETQSFINDLKKTYPDGLPRRTTLYRKIKDDKLKNFSVYGNQYGNEEGRQNVSILIQGPVKLQKSGNVYKFVSNHVHYNGEKMTGEFEPVLTAIYKGDRNDGGVKGTRIVIMPIAGRKMTGEI